MPARDTCRFPEETIGPFQPLIPQGISAVKSQALALNLRPASIQVIQWTPDLAGLLQAHMGALARGQDAVMTRQFLDKTDIRPGFRQMGGITVTPDVDAAGCPHPCLVPGITKHLLDTSIGIQTSYHLQTGNSLAYPSGERLLCRDVILIKFSTKLFQVTINLRADRYTCRIPLVKYTLTNAILFIVKKT
jgi:hypothetical protein